jgi:hypothetical protein
MSGMLSLMARRVCSLVFYLYDSVGETLSLGYRVNGAIYVIFLLNVLPVSSKCVSSLIVFMSNHSTSSRNTSGNGLLEVDPVNIF